MAKKAKSSSKKTPPSKCNKCKRKKVNGKCEECGRPPKLSDEVVQKLIDAFQRDFNNTEACIHAGISTRAYYYWLEQDEEFLRKITEAKRYLNMVAKQEHVKIIIDPDVSPKVKSTHIITQLKLRAKDPETGESEYVQQNAIKHSGGISSQGMTEEEKALIEKFDNLDEDELDKIDSIVNNA